MKARALKIKLVMMDLDGVLTDGRIVYGDYGDEIKFFDVQDGLGLSLLHAGGLRTAVISSRKSRINGRRARELKINLLFQKTEDKLLVCQKVMKKYKLSADEICFIGDDLVDRPVMSRVGLAVAVRNAVDEIREVSHYTTQKSGGRGAVRETADLILKAQGKWGDLTRKFYQ